MGDHHTWTETPSTPHRLQWPIGFNLQYTDSKTKSVRMSRQQSQSIKPQAQGTPSEHGTLYSHRSHSHEAGLVPRILVKDTTWISQSGMALRLCTSNWLLKDAGLSLSLTNKLLHKSHFLTCLLCQRQLQAFYFFHYSNKAAIKIGIKFKSPSIVSFKFDGLEAANLFIFMISSCRV